MTWKDKLEIGLKEGAPYRKDNLPESEVSGPEVPSGPGRSPEIPHARRAGAKAPVEPSTPPTPPKPRRVVHARAGWTKRSS